VKRDTELRDIYRDDLVLATNKTQNIIILNLDKGIVKLQSNFFELTSYQNKNNDEALLSSRFLLVEHLLLTN